MGLGQRIRKLRKEKSLTLAELAGSEITKGMLSLIENEKSRPSMETLGYLAKALDVSVSYLLQEGDEEWTREMVENDILYNMYTFPTEFVEEKILPNLDRISSSQVGMRLYHIVRVYYRYKGRHDLADRVTEKVTGFYEETGLRNLAVKDQVNDALSMLYSREYKKAYRKLLALEAEVQTFKEYDSGLELDYLYWRSGLALEFDAEDFIEYGKLLIESSFKYENFKYYFSQNVLFGYYYGTIGHEAEYERYNENLRKYLGFNESPHYKLEIFSEAHPVQLRFVLVEDESRHLSDLEKYRKKVMTTESTDPIYLKNYENTLKMIDLEINYHKGHLEYVQENFDPSLYDREVAQFPLDRIIIATRATVHPMSLFEAGHVDEARKAFRKLEASIADLKGSMFTKEFHEVQGIIFG
ncbi:helix-turn-helix domain-containing protein [Lacicoccus alkaliphilus]|uniref:DNA-binding transcriptional regulator, XRE-family HTH domain n=1 Tax=Lacicoccus alkaliphilus DSM 16010 TaxID=1123231 RepID=A0A1M7EB23_9BACL|nr:helix-turn-helix transcriptional regulator [Salinicoccus alkaliphilus]SHL88840.1 DNA-binding transcriptional regulator, XRE-family HTH domain [Salinicoccus alkaliphilus DSM 16010]